MERTRLIPKPASSLCELAPSPEGYGVVGQPSPGASVRWKSGLERPRSRQSPRTRALAWRQPIFDSFLHLLVSRRSGSANLPGSVRRCGRIAAVPLPGGSQSAVRLPVNPLASNRSSIGTNGLATPVLDRTFGGRSFANRHPNAAEKPSIDMQTSNPLKHRRQVWESWQIAEDGR
jgi:hypothetical protein